MLCIIGGCFWFSGPARECGFTTHASATGKHASRLISYTVTLFVSTLPEHAVCTTHKLQDDVMVHECITGNDSLG